MVKVFEGTWEGWQGSSDGLSSVLQPHWRFEKLCALWGGLVMCSGGT
jgi:hypothetical protein